MPKTLEEWFRAAESGTSGDMVMNILYDWKASLEVPTVTLECDKCGGSQIIITCTKDKCIHPERYCEGDAHACSSANVYSCTCKDGKVEWQVWWEIEKGVGLGRYEGESVDYEISKPLTATDLFDPDVALAWGCLGSRMNPDIEHIVNNKGRLVLRDLIGKGE